jgi:hypothetical protein
MCSSSALEASGPDAREELSDLPFPPAEVRADDLLLASVGDVGGVKVLATPVEQEVAFACSAEVPNPLRVAAGSDEVSGTGRPARSRPLRLATSLRRRH